MAKPKEPLWPIEPHTVAKHEILQRYLGRWIPILARFNDRILYIDGFAGPGKYAGGEDGSPVIALKIAKSFVTKKTVKPRQLTMLFVERDAKRHTLLDDEVLRLRQSDEAYNNINIVVLRSEYAVAMQRIWALLGESNQNLAPTFAFIDPFGVSGMPYEHVARLLSFPKTEVLINLMYEEANRFLTTPEFECHLDAFFGSTSWRSLKDIAGPTERRAATVQLFKQRLQTAGARYVQVFEMKNSHNRTDYLLFFATKSDKGLEAMKGAMWTVAPSGDFSFSDFTYAKGPRLIESSPDYRVLQEQLCERFAGKEAVAMRDIRRFVLAETSFYYFKGEALKTLEETGRIDVLLPAGRRRRSGTYPDSASIYFKPFQ